MPIKYLSTKPWQSLHHTTSVSASFLCSRYRTLLRGHGGLQILRSPRPSPLRGRIVRDIFRIDFVSSVLTRRLWPLSLVGSPGSQKGFLGLSGAVVKKKRTAQRAQGLMRSERALRATPAALCDAQASNQARCSLGTGFAPLPQSRWSRPSQRRRRIFEGSDPSTCQIATKPALSKQSAAPSANRCSASNIGHRTS